jgi:hypothetical protein
VCGSDLTGLEMTFTARCDGNPRTIGGTFTFTFRNIIISLVARYLTTLAVCTDGKILAFLTFVSQCFAVLHKLIDKNQMYETAS